MKVCRCLFGPLAVAIAVAILVAALFALAARGGRDDDSYCDRGNRVYPRAGISPDDPSCPQ